MSITKKGLRRLRVKIDYKDFALSKQPPKKKKKKSKLQKKKDNPFSGYWLRKADAIFGQIYHLKYCSNVCSVMKHLKGQQGLDKCEGHIEMAHLIPKENYLWRWELQNMLDLCSLHHKFSRIISHHSTPVQFSIFLKEHYPKKYAFVVKHCWEAVTRKIELPFTFKEKYEELAEVLKDLKLEN